MGRRGILQQSKIIPTMGGAARRYYVDTTGGNDANTGHSAGAAWKTIAKVNASTFLPRERVLFKRGETWREQLTIPSSGASGRPIYFGAYGSGNLPIITGASNITGFADGGSDIWDVGSITTQPLVVVIGNNAPQLKAANRAACTTPGSWYWAANTLSVYATSNPDGTVEAGQRNRAIDTNGKAYLTFENLTIKHSNALHSTGGGIWISTGNTIIVDGCTIIEHAGCGVLISGVSASVSIQDATANYNGENGIYNNNGLSTSQIICDNTISNNGWAAGASSGFGSGYQGSLTSGEIYGNTVDSNGLAGPAGTQHGIYLGSIDGSTVSIHNNNCMGHTQGSGIKARSSATIYKNYCANGANGVSCGDNSTFNVTYSVSYNVIVNCTSNSFIEQIAGTGTRTLYLYNNVMYNGGSGGNGSLKIDLDNAVLDIRNNILSVCSGLRIMWINATQTGTVTIDNNLYYQPGEATPFRSGATEQSWATWQAIPRDTNGFNEDPIFIDAPGGDFSLGISSPCINAGIDVGLITDYAGNSITGNPDIGAYEYP